MKSLSHVRLLATPWTEAHQAPPSVGFSRQEYCLGKLKGKVEVVVVVQSLSRVRLLATPWTAAHQAPPSMGFSRQEYWSGVPLPSPSGSLGKLKGKVEVVVVVQSLSCVQLFTTHGLQHARLLCPTLSP